MVSTQWKRSETLPIYLEDTPLRRGLFRRFALSFGGHYGMGGSGSHRVARKLAAREPGSKSARPLVLPQIPRRELTP